MQSRLVKGLALSLGERVARCRRFHHRSGTGEGSLGSGPQLTSSESSATAHPGDAELTGPEDVGRHSVVQNSSDIHRRASHASLIKAVRRKQLRHSQQRSRPGNALYQPGSNKFGGLAKGGFTPNQTVHNAVPVRTSSVARSYVLSRNNVRHRGPNPAVLGGSVNSNRRNTGAINGTRMNRRP